MDSSKPTLEAVGQELQLQFCACNGCNHELAMILKLISIALRGKEEAHEQDLTLIDFALRQILQKPVSQINWCFVDVPPSQLPEHGYNTINDQANTQQSRQLARFIICLLIFLMHSTLKGKGDNVREYYAGLQCLLQPQWGLPATAPRTDLLKSGMLNRWWTPP